MDGLRQDLMDELVASPVSAGLSSKRNIMSAGAVVLVSDHVDQHAGRIFQIFLPTFIETGNGTAVDNAVIA